MIYKRAYDNRGYNKPIRDGDLVEAVVNDEARYHDGQLEEVKAKLDKLTEIVGRLFLYLPTDRTKREIAEALMWEAKQE
jgi:hypothetical protein